MINITIKVKLDNRARLLLAKSSSGLRATSKGLANKQDIKHLLQDEIDTVLQDLIRQGEEAEADGE